MKRGFSKHTAFALTAIWIALPVCADYQQPENQKTENLKTLQGTVIEKPWTKSFESWNAGGGEYYVLDVGQTHLPQGSRSAKEGVILRPSRGVPFEQFKKFKGKQVTVKGRFVEAKPHKPTHPNEQMPGDHVGQYPVEPTVVDGPDGKPILGPRRPAPRGSGFQVYEILPVHQSDVAPGGGLSGASMSTERLRESLRASKEELRRREMGEGPRWTIPTDLLRKRVEDYEAMLQAREAANTRPTAQSKQPPPAPPKESAGTEPDRTNSGNQALGALETFLGALASKDFKAAYKLVAPSSKKNGDPIAYQAPLDYEAFLAELTQHVSDDAAPADGLHKFMGYKLGNRRWESLDRFRVLVTFQGWDNDEVLLVREDGKWYVADPIHIIR